MLMYLPNMIQWKLGYDHINPSSVGIITQLYEQWNMRPCELKVVCTFLAHEAAKRSPHAIASPASCAAPYGQATVILRHRYFSENSALSTKNGTTVSTQSETRLQMCIKVCTTFHLNTISLLPRNIKINPGNWVDLIGIGMQLTGFTHGSF